MMLKRALCSLMCLVMLFGLLPLGQLTAAAEAAPPAAAEEQLPPAPEAEAPTAEPAEEPAAEPAAEPVAEPGAKWRRSQRLNPLQNRRLNLL